MRDSLVIELPSPLAVVCHDAGAANMAFAWIAASSCVARAFVQGPAERLWRERFGQAALCASMDEALQGSALLCSGTGWASDLEHIARRKARELGLPSAAVIDHWVNYPQRFERQGQVVWPDEFWVADGLAEAQALQCFPGQVVRRFPNLYLQEQLERIPVVDPNAACKDVLYVLEPARGRWGREEPGEFQALDYFFGERSRLDLPEGHVLRLRPHPSDPPGKYDEWITARSGAVRLDGAGTLAEALASCAWVAGTESFALVVALAAGRKVVCSLPPWAPPCRLPHGGLIHLKDLAQSR